MKTLHLPVSTCKSTSTLRQSCQTNFDGRTASNSQAPLSIAITSSKTQVWLAMIAASAPVTILALLPGEVLDHAWCRASHYYFVNLLVLSCQLPEDPRDSLLSSTTQNKTENRVMSSGASRRNHQLPVHGSKVVTDLEPRAEWAARHGPQLNDKLATKDTPHTTEKGKKSSKAKSSDQKKVSH